MRDEERDLDWAPECEDGPVVLNSYTGSAPWFETC